MHSTVDGARQGDMHTALFDPLVLCISTEHSVAVLCYASSVEAL